MYGHRHLLRSQLRERAAGGLKLAALAAVALVLGGCVTSPYHGQTFDTRSTQIPMQAWTTNKTDTVAVECTSAYHPNLSSTVWTSVASQSPDSTPHYDPKGAALYSVAVKQALPYSCWQASGGDWFTALRFVQDGRTFDGFTKAGLECLGRENARAESYSGYLTKNCAATYSNSSSKLPYIRIYAEE